MSLLEDMRAVVRVSTDMTDGEILMLADAAIEDMRRMGIREELLAEDGMDPLAKASVAFYVNANYGHDDKERDHWWQQYVWATTSMLNSRKNVCAT